MTLPNGLDTKDLKFLGKGAQGEVYQIDESRCIKIFTRSKGLPRELENLQKAEYEPCFPKVFEWGDNYIIREYIEGMELRAYLRKNPLTESISFQLVDLLQAFERLHFTRIDTQLKNVIKISKAL
jgi:predicted Ser/Thr protein kinase